MKLALIGSEVVKVAFQVFGVISWFEPITCRVLVIVDVPPVEVVWP